MTNEIQTTSPEAQFRAIAADRMVTAANMTLHDLLDEFQRLSALVEEGRILPTDPEEYGVKYTDTASLAINELGIFNGAAKARFGVYFSIYSQRGDQF